MKYFIQRAINLVSQVILTSFLIVVLISTVLSLFFSYFLPRANHYRDDLLDWLNQQNPGITIQAEHIAGRWEAFRPSLELTDVSVFKSSWDSELTFSKLTIQFDILKTLRREKVIFSNVSLSDLNFSLVQAESGQWTLSTDNAVSDSNPIDMKPIIESLWSIENLNIDDVKLKLTPFGCETLRLPDFHVQGMSRQGLRHLVVHLKDDEKDVNVLIANAWGDPYDDAFKAKGYLHVKDFQASELFKFLGNERLQKGKLNLDFWFDWSDSIFDAVADINIKNIDYLINNKEEGGQSSNENRINHLKAQVKINHNNGESQVWLPKISMLSKSGNIALDNVYINKKNNVFLYLRSFDLSQLNIFDSLQLLPTKVNKVLSDLEPSGIVSDMTIEQVNEDFVLRADIDNVSVQPWRAVPQMKSISGSLVMNKDRGKIYLDTNNFSLFFPFLYSQSQEFDHAKGEVGWEFDTDWLTLAGKDLVLQGAYGEAMGEFHLKIPLSETFKEEEPSRLSLSIGLTQADIKNRRPLIPDKKLSNELLHWLDNQIIDEGMVAEAGFIFHGPLNKPPSGLDEQVAIQLWLDIKEGKLDYVPELVALEKISGDLLLDDDEVFANINQASTGEIAVNNASFSLIKVDEKYKMDLASRIYGAAESIHNYLSQPIISESVERIFEKIHFNQGMLEGKLVLNANLFEFKDSLNLVIKSKLRQFNIDIPEHNIAISDIFGDLEFSTAKGLYSPLLEGKFFDKPIKASIKTSQTMDTSVNFKTDVDINDINSWRYFPSLTFFQGQSQVEGILLFNQHLATIEFSSNLKGVVCDLPVPFGKTKEEKKSIHLSLPLSGKNRSLSIQYGQLDVGVLFEEDHPIAGTIHFNGEQLEFEKDAFVVSGLLDYANISDWLDALNKFKLALAHPSLLKENSDDWAVIIDGITVNRLSLNDFSLNDVRLSGKNTFDKWHLDFTQSFLKGDLVIFNDENKPLQVSFDSLNLDEFTKVYHASKEKNSEAIDLHNFPSMKVAINQLIYQKKQLGAWRFDTYVDKASNTLVATDILVKRDKLEVLPLNDDMPTELTWSPELNVTTLQGKLKGSDFSEVLLLLGFDKEITSKKFSLAGQIQWLGRPDKFEMKLTEGEAIFDFHGGSFTEIESSSSKAIQVFGIFNVSYLLKRLQLDFSDLTKKGFAFDTVKGGIILDRGVIETDGPVVIKSASSNIKIDGVTNINDSTLDLDMSVTLPLASNIPWIATLIATGAAGLWPAAGVFLVSHLFKNQVDKLSTFVYRIKGSIQDPAIQFKKIFDDEGKEKKLRNKSDTANSQDQKLK